MEVRAGVIMEDVADEDAADFGFGGGFAVGVDFGEDGLFDDGLESGSRVPARRSMGLMGEFGGDDCSGCRGRGRGLGWGVGHSHLMTTGIQQPNDEYDEFVRCSSARVVKFVVISDQIPNPVCQPAIRGRLCCRRRIRGLWICCWRGW